MAIGTKCRSELHNSQTPKKSLESPILREHTTDFRNDLLTFHAKTVKVFGEGVGLPVSTDKRFSITNPTKKTPSPSRRAQRGGGGQGFGGEADIDLYIGHIRTPDITAQNDLRIKYGKKLEGFYYLVSVDSYGKGNSEGIVGKHEFPDLKPKADKVRINKCRSQMSDDDLKKSEQRAASKIRKKAIMLRPIDMLTLTSAVPIYSRKEALKTFRKFAREMQKRFNKFDYIMVMERHKKGDIHFHLAITRSYHWNTIRYIWKNALGNLGNVHFSQDKRFSKNQTFKTAQRIAGYLKKYFTKDDASEFGENRYSFSKGIPQPRKERFYIPIVDYTFELVEQLIKEVTGKNIIRVFDIPDNPRAELWFSTFS